MAKSTKKTQNGRFQPKKEKKLPYAKKKAVELISSLLELHKLQGVLLTQLRKEI